MGLGTAAARRKVAVVTGGASGLGRQISLNLARLGFDLAVVGRNGHHLEEFRQLVDGETGRPTVRPILTSDLAVPAEARRVATLLAATCPAIDVLVNNAGGIFARREEVEGGIERTFGLNVLAPFALTYHLTPALLRAAPSRVVNIASAAHRGHSIALDDLFLRHGYGGYRAYGRSKLALILLTREFARKFAGTGVSVLAVHPGFVRTNFGRNNPGALGVGFRVAIALFAIGVAAGADTPTFAATDPSAGPLSGSYLVHRSPRPGSRISRDSVLAGRLFERCSELVGVPPGSQIGHPP